MSTRPLGSTSSWVRGECRYGRVPGVGLVMPFVVSGTGGILGASGGYVRPTSVCRVRRAADGARGRRKPTVACSPSASASIDSTEPSTSHGSDPGASHGGNPGTSHGDDPIQVGAKLMGSVVTRMVLMVAVSVIGHSLVPHAVMVHSSNPLPLLPFGDGDLSIQDATWLLTYILLVKPILRLSHQVLLWLKITKLNYDKGFAGLVEPPLFWLGILFAWLSLCDGVYTYMCPAGIAGSMCSYKPIQLTIISVSAYFCVVINFLKRLFLKELDPGSWSRRHRGEYIVMEKMFTVISVAILIIFSAFQLGMTAKTLLAYGGFGTILFGFASQHILKDVMAGIMLFTFKPFVTGDNIRLPSFEKGGMMRVMDIGWIYTELQLWDSSPAQVPNSSVYGSIVVNRSLKRFAYTTQLVHIRYADLPRLDDLLESMRNYLAHRPEISKENKPVVVVEKLDSSFVDVRLMIWLANVSTKKRMAIVSSILIGLANTIKDNGCEFAMPRIEVVSDAGAVEEPESPAGRLEAGDYRESLKSFTAQSTPTR